MSRNNCFPTTIVDNFFEQPDVVRKFALDQEYYTSVDNSSPGKRSRLIDEINPILFDGTVKKISNLFYNPEDPIRVQCISTFQIVSKHYSGGWIHKDDPMIFTAIVYLTPGSDQGTSLYKKKDIFTNAIQWETDKMKAYSEGSDNVVSRENNNSLFEETVNIKGLYNRLVVFDSLMYHGAHNFFGDTDDTSRLTMIMFFSRFSCDGQVFPIQRMNAGFSPTIL